MSAAQPTTSAPAGGSAPLLRVRREPSASTVLLVASFGAFLAFLDSTIVNIAFPDIQASFPTSRLGALSWVLNSYNIVFAAFLVLAGRGADLLGRRRVFVTGVVVFTVASVLCAVAQTVLQLVAFRLLQGVGAALLVPASLALVVEAFPPARRAHGVGLWGAAAAIASGLGPPVGGALVGLSSWRLAFLVNLPLGVLAVVLARRGLVESRAPGRRRLPDLRGALLLAAGLGLLVLALVQGPDSGWTSPLVLAGWVGAVVGLGGFVASSRVSPAPLIDPALTRLRSFSVAGVLTVVAGAGFYAYLLTHVLYLRYVWDYSLLRAGLAVAPAAFVAAAAAAGLGRVADRVGHRLVVVPGALVWAGSLLWYLERVGSRPDFLHDWLPGQVLQGLGVGATLPLLGAAAVAMLPKDSGYATASAVISSARQLGAVLGVALLVVLVGTPAPQDVQERLRAGWVLALCCLLAVSVGALLLGPTRAAPAPEPVVTALVPQQADPPVLEQPAAPAPAAPADDADALADLPLLAGLPRAAQARLRAQAETVEVRAGQYLFRAGDDADALYVVLSGRLDVLQDGVVLTELGRGAVVGELALLTGAPRSADVRAVRDSRLVRLTRAQFDALADAGVLRTLAAGLARRLQEIAPPAVSAPPPPATVVAVVGLDPGAPVAEVAAALLAHLRRALRVADPGRVDRDGLERAERDADLVVLRAGAGDGTEDGDWAASCLRVADRVVVVATEPPAGPLPERAVGADLVLVRAAPREERQRWDELLRPTSTHQVARDDLGAGLRPLAARLSGRSLGLVLGGGGARAFAHLGVLDELEAAGLHVDRVAGASVGGVIAAAHACGWDAATVDAQVYENFVRRNPIGDYALPTKGLVRGRRTVTGLERAFGGRLLEELPRQLRVVSVDLLARRRHVHERGLVSAATASSLRLPGLYPPLPFDGSLHVDGGVLDNLPVSTLTGPEGPVVAVSISFGGSGRPPSGRTKPPRVPALGDTLLRTMMMGSGQAAAEAIARADLVLRPDAAGVGLLEFSQIDRMRASGREAARAALPEIAALVARGSGRPAD